jgi:hypothetical protein
MSGKEQHLLWTSEFAFIKILRQKCSAQGKPEAR